MVLIHHTSDQDLKVKLLNNLRKILFKPTKVSNELQAVVNLIVKETDGIYAEEKP
jgi:hypothetical protein